MKIFFLVFKTHFELKKFGLKFVCEKLKKQKNNLPNYKKIDNEQLINMCSMINRQIGNHILRKKALCLHKSIVGFILLIEKDINVEICFGAGKHNFEAHAWLEHNGMVVNDDNNTTKEKYNLLFKF
jgi:CRISPR/Cas system-associated protein Csx1